MTYETLFEFLLWNSIFNILILALWGIFFLAGNNWMYNFHRKWFDIDKQQFDMTHYKGMGYFKILIFVFNIIPLLVLWKMGGF